MSQSFRRAHFEGQNEVAYIYTGVKQLNRQLHPRTHNNNYHTVLLQFSKKYHLNFAVIICSSFLSQVLLNYRLFDCYNNEASLTFTSAPIECFLSASKAYY